MGSVERRGESRRTVVVAFPIGSEAREALATMLGSEFVVRDIREAVGQVDVVLCPPVSPQAIGHLRREYPGAAVVAIELDDLLWGTSVQGPVGRLFDAGIDAYFVAQSLRELGGFLQRVVDESPSTDSATDAIEVGETAALAPADPSTAIPEAHGAADAIEVVQPVGRHGRPDP